MDIKRLLVQTIPAAGAISLSACAPVRDNIGDGSGGGGIFGAWELRSWSAAGGTPYEYPTVYTNGDCTTTRGFFLEIDRELVASMASATIYEGCPYYSQSYAYRYPGAAEDLRTGFLTISIPGWSLSMDCPESPAGDDMACSGTSGGSAAELGFARVDPSVIPASNNGGGATDGVDL